MGKLFRFFLQALTSHTLKPAGGTRWLQGSTSVLMTYDSSTSCPDGSGLISFVGKGRPLGTQLRKGEGKVLLQADHPPSRSPPLYD